MDKFSILGSKDEKKWHSSTTNSAQMAEFPRAGWEAPFPGTPNRRDRLAIVSQHFFIGISLISVG
jgi:hypothetical protein